MSFELLTATIGERALLLQCSDIPIEKLDNIGESRKGSWDFDPNELIVLNFRSPNDFAKFYQN